MKILSKNVDANGSILEGNTLLSTKYQAKGNYEPAFTKNTAFNKNFGSVAGTVAEGNHVHVWDSISGKPVTFNPSEHNHDDRYYTETETNTLLNGKANTSHTHDDRYYTETEIDAKSIPFVVGTQVTTTSAWTGIASDLTAIADGTTIRYWLPRTSTSTSVTLDLTLKGGGTTGAIPCYYGGSTRLTTHYSAGMVIILTYVVNQLINGVAYTGWYAQGQYNTSYSTITQAEIDAGTSTSTRVVTPAMLRYATSTAITIGTVQPTNGSMWYEVIG